MMYHQSHITWTPPTTSRPVYLSYLFTLVTHNMSTTGKPLRTNKETLTFPLSLSYSTYSNSTYSTVSTRYNSTCHTFTTNYAANYAGYFDEVKNQFNIAV